MHNFARPAKSTPASEGGGLHSVQNRRHPDDIEQIAPMFTDNILTRLNNET